MYKNIKIFILFWYQKSRWIAVILIQQQINISIKLCRIRKFRYTFFSKVWIILCSYLHNTVYHKCVDALNSHLIETQDVMHRIRMIFITITDDWKNNFSSTLQFYWTDFVVLIFYYFKSNYYLFKSYSWIIHLE